MADTKISDLTALTGANVADDDEFVIVDTSAAQSKRITRAELANGGFTSLNVTGTVTADGLTVESTTATILNTTGADASEIGTLYFSNTNSSSGNHASIRGVRTTAAAGAMELYTKDAGSLIKRISIDNLGDISFYDSTGTSQNLFWDASASRLGIGTTSPNRSLTIEDGDVQIHETGTVNDPLLNFSVGGTQASPTQSWSLRIDNSDGDKFQLLDVTDSRTVLTADGSGNVGIGTSSPTFASAAFNGVEISYSTIPTLRLTDTSNTSFDIFKNGLDVTLVNRDAGYLRFDTSNSERMRLDSSGRLMVGKTATGLGNVGVELDPSGQLKGTAANVVVQYLNRTSSDGTILEYRKDNTTVGSIGSRSGVVSYIVLDPRTSVKGASLIGGSNGTTTGIINPGKNDGDIADAAIDLGSTGARFKDLHLSGTIQIEKGTGNVGVGKQALNSNTASNNTAVGYQAGYSNTTGSPITAFGWSALRANTTGVHNTAIGTDALRTATTSQQNTALGSHALYSTTTGSYNTALGREALRSNTTASNNVAVGYQAGYSNTTGQSNILMGRYAGYANTGGAQNVAIGDSSLYTNTGNYNVAIGGYALLANTTASNNTAVGYQAGYSNTTGTGMVALGINAYRSGTTGNQNVAIGNQALWDNTTGSDNVAVGAFALENNTTANYNVAVGRQAGYSQSTSSRNVYLGWQAGYSHTGDLSVFVGDYAGFSTTGGSNTFVGRAAGNTVTTGSKNTIIGAYNGNQGGLDIRTASNHIVLSDGDGNPRVHVDASSRVYIGPENTGSARFNVHSSGGSLWSGTFYQLSNSDITNLNCRHDYARSGQNATQINFQDYQGIDRGSIKTNNSSTSYNTSSDYRLKENVVEITGATDRLKQLKPSRFNFINDPDRTVDGFLAHEVSDIVPEAISGEKDAVDADNNPKYQQIDQSKLVPLLTAALQEALTKIESLEARITALENA